MRKENILVGVLICMAAAGVLAYQYSAVKNTDTPSDADRARKVEATSTIGWENFEKGMLLANKENKHVFLYFHAEWCTYCTKLKKTTFKDKDVLTYLAQNFISISVDADQHRELAKQWRVRGLPTIWFLKPDGSKISNIPGYINAGQMIKFLEYIHLKTYEQIGFNDFIKTL